MGAGHDHGANANSRTLLIALALTGTFLIAEIVAGFVFNSLALLSDAAHMFTDAAALALALIAIRIGATKADDLRTFGYRRFEILAAAFNAILLFGAAIYVLVEGIRRFFEPQTVQSTGMLVVAVLGLVINLISMRLLSGAKETSLNVKGAYLEVWADMLGSLGVIAGALVIRFTGWTWVDPVIAIAIGLWVLPRTWTLLRASANVLLESVPPDLVLADVRKTIKEVDGVKGVHELHVWISGADQTSASAHVVLADGADGDDIRRVVARRLRDAFRLEHVTIQTERVACEDAAITHV
ncbi:MAG TPA: cation diffusion facilitator family transporter [Caulobacterales bacterium]|nr:cation diffusion facilitator family transporter [Caulobacterales bacterium]